MIPVITDVIDRFSENGKTRSTIMEAHPLPFGSREEWLDLLTVIMGYSLTDSGPEAMKESLFKACDSVSGGIAGDL